MICWKCPASPPDESTFRKNGVMTIRGLDGHGNRDLLEIPPEDYTQVDLGKAFRVERVFDLALSLEVAEHLPPSTVSGT